MCARDGRGDWPRWPLSHKIAPAATARTTARPGLRTGDPHVEVQPGPERDNRVSSRWLLAVPFRTCTPTSGKRAALYLKGQPRHRRCARLRDWQTAVRTAPERRRRTIMMTLVPMPLLLLQTTADRSPTFSKVPLPSTIAFDDETYRGLRKRVPARGIDPWRVVQHNFEA